MASLSLEQGDVCFSTLTVLVGAIAGAVLSKLLGFIKFSYEELRINGKKFLQIFSTANEKAP